MGVINKEELSSDLIEYLKTLGKTEQEIIQIIKENVNSNNINITGSDGTKGLEESLKEINTKINTVSNEINSGKEIISSSIGEPLSSIDSFIQMNTKIDSLKQTFKNNLFNKGVNLVNETKLSEFIEKINDIRENKFPEWYATGNIWINCYIKTYHKGHTMSVVGNNIYVFGGSAENMPTPGNMFNDDFNIYNVSTNNWGNRMEQMPTVGSTPSCESYKSDIFVIGGNNGENYNRLYYKTNRMYSTTKKTWTLKTPIPKSCNLSGSVIIDEKIMILGNVGEGPKNIFYEYNILTDTWSEKEFMPDELYDVSISRFTATCLDDKIYVFTGSYVFYYNLITRTWTSHGKLNSNATGAHTLNGNIYLFNGNGAYKYNAYTNTTNSMATMELSGGVGGTSVKVNNSVHYIGGELLIDTYYKRIHECYIP